MELLKKLIEIPGVSGEESKVSEFVIDYVKNHKDEWQTRPEIIYGEGFQDCIILKFGKPRLAAFAHMDSVGYHVKYGKELIKIGGPFVNAGDDLIGEDSIGKIECKLEVDDENKKLFYRYFRQIETGTSLTYKPVFIDKHDHIQSCYLDDRLGIWVLLKIAEKITDGILVFSCWEEHGGGSVSFLTKYIYEKFNISQAIICDITWVTDGVKKGSGVAISQRDKYIPRKTFFNKIVQIARTNHINFQTEVEDSGGSDGSEIQRSPYPVDWCFIGAPELNNHSPKEIVYKSDIDAMIKLYELLFISL